MKYALAFSLLVYLALSMGSWLPAVLKLIR